ncbi:MAG: helix-turn-helix domain-containing protein, partial [Candidatus Krumholzibacteriia bacterium]
ENDKPVLKISEGAHHTMQAKDWPGHVRQLQNVIARAVILGAGDLLDESLLGLADEIDATEKPRGISGDMTLKDMERELILRKLETTRGNRTQAAHELGISVRTLRNKLNLYTEMGVEIPG